jgi:murein DD-endopeptidase MepM/ murein hydrolase activator NlpD
MIKLYLLLAAICVSVVGLSQNKDSLKLICPLNEAVEPPVEKQPYSLGVQEVKIVLTSPTDTTVKACMAGTVTNIMRDDDGTYMVMFNSKDYYFLYSGITKTSARKGQKLNQGEMIGVLKPGGKLEFQIYDFETPLDPRKYVSCVK